MKIEDKVIGLMEIGLSPDTILKLTEGQINTLHTKLGLL
jgi:hypothetical protein